jgi:hypothetical protein
MAVDEKCCIAAMHNVAKGEGEVAGHTIDCRSNRKAQRVAGLFGY